MRIVFVHIAVTAGLAIAATVAWLTLSAWAPAETGPDPVPPPPPASDCMLPWANPLPRCAGAPPLPCDRVHGGQGIPGVC